MAAEKMMLSCVVYCIYKRSCVRLHVLTAMLEPDARNDMLIPFTISHFVLCTCVFVPLLMVLWHKTMSLIIAGVRKTKINSIHFVYGSSSHSVECSAHTGALSVPTQTFFFSFPPPFLLMHTHHKSFIHTNNNSYRSRVESS